MKTESRIGEYPTLKIVISGVCIALGVLLPQAFHVFGSSAGKLFLPIQLSVFLAGLILGPYFGGIVGFCVPLLSFALTGMPQPPNVYVMTLESIAYGVVTGWLIKKQNVYISLIGAMVIGRIVNGGAWALMALIFGTKSLELVLSGFFTGIVTGIPGIVIQLIILPLIYFAWKRGGTMYGSTD
jgi:niacin transporter